MHAQYDTDKHVKAIRANIPFVTSGNLSGTPTHWASAGWMRGAARLAFSEDRDSDQVNYVIRSYGTPIAWRTKNGQWHIDHSRHGAASDKALSQAVATVHKLASDTVLETTHIGHNYRHGLSEAQLGMLIAADIRPVTPTGQAKRTMGTLLSKGYLINGPFDTYLITDLGRAILFGWPVKVQYAPYQLEAVTA